MSEMPSITQFTKPQSVSLTAQSLSKLQAAIHSPCDGGETLKRANICLKLYFDPDGSPADRAAIREAFVRALADVPTWAMHKAFDAWERSGVRRPSPGEIAILAKRELMPFTDEIKRREKAEAQRREEAESYVPDAAAKAAVERIVQQAGFTVSAVNAVRKAPMAASIEEAEEAAEKPRKAHWSEVTPPDSPKWDALRAERDRNPLIAAARADAARKREAGA